MFESIYSAINSKIITVGVVGLGYVGLPLAVEKSIAGYKTIGFDINKDRVKKVNFGESYIDDVSDKDLQNAIEDRRLVATDDFSYISCADFIAICVPTPLDKFKQPDLSYIIASCMEIARYMQRGTVVVLESTTYPKTTRELVMPLLEKGSGMKCGVDFFLGFSPERVDPGNALYKTKNTPKVVGGIDENSTKLIAQLYKNVLSCDIIEVSSPEIAEMEKLLENTYRNINIGLINELAMLCNRMGINIWEVIDAAKTKPYGFNAFYPGGGLGGHCIPLDPYYLSWKAKEYGFYTSMIESSMMINDNMPIYCTNRIADILNRDKKSIMGSNILILGVAYKQDISDCRESPSIKICEELIKRGGNLSYFDPHVKSCTIGENVYNSIKKLTEQQIVNADLVVIATCHTNVDYEMVSTKAKSIFDIKNAMKNINKRDNIEVL